MGPGRAAFAAFLTFGCGGSAPSVDAGPDSGAEPDGGVDAALDRPATAALPVLLPCPPGWREIPASIAGGAARCDAFPDGGPATCERWEAHFPGEPGCVAVGAACPADGWPAGVPESAVFVREGAAAGGDGSRAAPYATLDEAVAAAPDGAIVAIGAGRYEQPGLVIRRSMTLAGACAERTEIAGLPGGPFNGNVVVLNDTDVTLRDLRVTGPDNIGVVVTSRVTLQGVVIHDVRGEGLSGNAGSVITARDLLIRNVAAEARVRGIGIASSDRATVDVRRASIEATVLIGVQAAGEDAVVRLSDVAIRGVRVGSGPEVEEFAYGVSVLGAATELTRVHLSDVDAIGVYVGYGSARLQDVTVEDVHEVYDPDHGIFIGDGVLVEAGTLEARRLSIGDARVVGLAIGAGEATIEDVVVRGAADDADALPGQGVVVRSDAAVDCRLDATRLLVEAAHDVGLFVAGPRSTLIATDVIVRSTRSRRDGATGRGLQVQGGATIDATRVLLAANREVGALVASSGSDMRLLDLTVEDTMPSAAGLAGSGVVALLDGHASIARFLVRRNALAGLQLARGGTADLMDGEISGNTIGANVQTTAFDLDRIRRNVLYRDNGVDLDSEARPVPEPMPP